MKEAPDPQNFELKKMNFSHKVRKIFYFKIGTFEYNSIVRWENLAKFEIFNTILC